MKIKSKKINGLIGDNEISASARSLVLNKACANGKGEIDSVLICSEIPCGRICTVDCERSTPSSILLNHDCVS